MMSYNNKLLSDISENLWITQQYIFHQSENTSYHFRSINPTIDGQKSFEFAPPHIEWNVDMFGYESSEFKTIFSAQEKIKREKVSHLTSSQNKVDFIETGRLLCYNFVTLQDGVSENFSDYLIDNQDYPAIDTWVWHGEIEHAAYLICWIPNEIVESIQDGIDGNCSEGLNWLDAFFPELNFILENSQTFELLKRIQRPFYEPEPNEKKQLIRLDYAKPIKQRLQLTHKGKDLYQELASEFEFLNIKWKIEKEFNIDNWELLHDKNLINIYENGGSISTLELVDIQNHPIPNNSNLIKLLRSTNVIIQENEILTLSETGKERAKYVLGLNENSRLKKNLKSEIILVCIAIAYFLFKYLILDSKPSIPSIDNIQIPLDKIYEQIDTLKIEHP